MAASPFDWHNVRVTETKVNAAANLLSPKMSCQQSSPVYFTNTTRNVGQLPTWWPPCRIQVAPSVQRRKVWLTLTSRVPCSNAAKTRNPLKFAMQGCLKLAIRSQPVVDQSSPYYEDMWRRYCCLTRFFSDCRYIPYLRRYSLTKLCDGAQMAIFGDFFASCICSEPRAAGFRPAF